MSVILTIPHAVCRAYPPVRNCDRVAERAALILAELLDVSFDVEVITGNIFRATMDLNRVASINTPFQQEIRAKIKLLTPVFLFDIHSFPPDGNNFQHTQLTILDESPGTEYGISLRDFMRDKYKEQYTIGYYHGDKNFIMIQARQMDIPCLLLEYNESLPDKEIRELSNGVVEWLTSI